MANHTGANVGCLVVGEYVDEAELPLPLVNPNKVSQVERPRVVATYLDLWSKDDGDKEFTVLLNDKRVLTVRGHGLQYIQNPSNPSDYGSYAILARTGSEDVVVALFRVAEVSGIFSGARKGTEKVGTGA